MAISDRGYGSIDRTQTHDLGEVKQDKKSDFVGPLALRLANSDSGEVYYNIVSGEGRPLLFVNSRSEDVAKELVRLANMGLSLEAPESIVKTES